MAQIILCTVASCGKKHFCRGYCSAHYKKLRKWGDPLGGRTPSGDVRKWVEAVAVPYAGDECLPFPYCKTADGYGRFTIDGVTVSAHVFILEKTGGPKPTPRHECCHSCGNGDEACVTPNHMYWGTRKENVEDARRHGTLGLGYRVRGESHHHSKITDNEVAAILSDLAAGELQKSIARKYGISQAHVSRIKIGQSRKNK